MAKTAVTAAVPAPARPLTSLWTSWRAANEADLSTSNSLAILKFRLTFGRGGTCRGKSGFTIGSKYSFAARSQPSW